MSVAELIEKLKMMPQDVRVNVRAMDQDTKYYVGCEEAHSVEIEDEEVYINGKDV
jgi:translation elongation factor EF-1beta